MRASPTKKQTKTKQAYNNGRIRGFKILHDLEQSLLYTGLSVFKRKEEYWWLLSCSALGVILRRLLYEHSRPIAYPAAKVQTGDAQGNQTMPSLQKMTAKREVTIQMISSL